MQAAFSCTLPTTPPLRIRSAPPLTQGRQGAVGGRSSLRPPSFVLPPSDEGGGKPEGFDGGRDTPSLCKGDTQNILIANSLPQSPAATAPSSEGAKGVVCCRGPPGVSAETPAIERGGKPCFLTGKRKNSPSDWTSCFRMSCVTNLDTC